MSKDSRVSQEWLKGLNPEQSEAVLHDYGPLLILAGAGSGKTTVLVARTGRLLAQKLAAPEEVTVLTFTNKAARELKERVAKRIGRQAEGIWAGTFHSFGLQVLRKYHREAELPEQFGIIDSNDARAIVREQLKQITHYEKESFDAEKILSLINEWREKGQTKAKEEDVYHEVTEILLPKYLKQLELLGVVDFDGLLLKPLELFDQHPEILRYYNRQIKQLMVDEFQDTNTMQMKLVMKLVEEHNNLTVVGDDDQSIYGWRGARIENILNFPHLFDECKVVRLERNYRSTGLIIEVANEVIKKNSQRHEKILRPGLDHENSVPPEVFVYDSEEDEAEEVVQQIMHFHREGYDFKDIAVLFRSNSQGGLLEGILRHHQIPYSLTGGTAFFDRKEIRDVLAYLRCSILPNEVAFRRVINTPPRGIGEATIKSMEAFSRQNRLSLHEAAQRWQLTRIAPHIGSKVDQVLAILRNLSNTLIQSPDSMNSGEVLTQFFRDIGYQDYVYQNYKDASTAHKRWTLIEIFGRVLDAFVAKGGKNIKTIKEFLDAMELRDRVDEAADLKDKSKVQLLTLHACKGLEYPVVIIVGVEEDLLPHHRLGMDIDEERRLFYVGVTRAKQRLVMTRSRQRKRFGKMRPSVPSRFLLEIPEDMLTVYESGFRPISETDRKSMLSDLFKKLDNKIERRDKEESPL